MVCVSADSISDRSALHQFSSKTLYLPRLMLLILTLRTCPAISGIVIDREVSSDTQGLGAEWRGRAGSRVEEAGWEPSGYSRTGGQIGRRRPVCR